MAQALDLKKALVGALVAHAALIAAIGARRPSPAPRASDAGATSSVEIDVEPEAERAGPSPAVHAASGGTALARSTARSTAIAGRSGDVRETPASPSEPVGRDEESGVASDGWSFWTVTTVAGTAGGTAARDLGMRAGGGNATMRSAVDGVIGRDAPANAPGEGAMASVQRGVDLHDREVGLGAGGPLVGVTRDAVRDGLTASVGHALLEFRTDGTGIVIGVRVLEANAERRAWDDVAARLTESASKKRLRVPPGAKGVAVTVRVESAMKTASAHDAGETSVSVFGIPVKKSRAAHPVHVDVSIPIVSMTLDPTDALLDATTRPVRVVSVWVEDERRL